MGISFPPLSIPLAKITSQVEALTYKNPTSPTHALIGRFRSGIRSLLEPVAEINLPKSGLVG